MINDLPTVFEAVTGVKQTREQAAPQNNSSKNKSSVRMVGSSCITRYAVLLSVVIIF